MKRPLILVALFYVAGILLAGFIALAPATLLAISLSLALIALAWPRARLLLLCPLLALAGWTNLTLRTATLSPHDLRLQLGEQPELITIRGTLPETPSRRAFVQDEKESWRSLARLDVTAASIYKASCRRSRCAARWSTHGSASALLTGPRGRGP